jgi:hypothetical protein
MRALPALVMRLIRSLHGILRRWRSAIDTQAAIECQASVLASASPPRTYCHANAPVTTAFDSRAGVQLLADLACALKSASATYAKFSPVDNF